LSWSYKYGNDPVYNNSCTFTYTYNGNNEPLTASGVASPSGQLTTTIYNY
jgi:hypothetical protein